MARKRLKVLGRQEAGTFFRVPTSVLESAAYRTLSMKGKSLLLDLGAQFRGYNNGHLSPSWTLMRQWGWSSKQTLQRALEELLRAGLLEKSRQGGRNRCSLFAFTWLAIDKGTAGAWLDVQPTRVASGLWRRRSEEIAKNASASPIVRAPCPDNRGSDARSAL
ncbi:MAG: hypothetical protein M0P72_06605 [Metallibacterium scheffleri]|jgi:hypothetical protein|uniref:hypothetical protein n=1 Tax=Metallibacterium scheffleri TaxID=993689 RepID=UPI0026EAB126|nr:hypothetical protein [Metallibacterium scheffleri]MCK9366802.1 hypothetical protein [Metallibacterium scheffleri]